MLKALRLYLPFVLIFNFLTAQKTMQIYKFRLSSYKKFELYCGDKIAYKLKGEHFFHRHAIANMSDSLLLLDNDSVIKISRIKAIRFNRGGNVLGRISLLFVKAGIILMYVNLAANIVYGSEFKIDRKILYANAALGAAYVIFQVWNIKRIKVKRSVTIRVFDPHYEKINALST